jgi:hypothetical protein
MIVATHDSGMAARSRASDITPLESAECVPIIAHAGMPKVGPGLKSC